MLEIIIYGIVIYVAYILFFKKKKPTPEQIAEQEEKNRKLKEEQERQAEIEKEKRKEQERKRKEQERKRKEAEQQLLAELENSKYRLYFSYSLVSEDSSIYLINPLTNNIVESSETSLKKLYQTGWRLVDVDKTGKSAQLSDFNFVLRLEKFD